MSSSQAPGSGSGSAPADGIDVDEIREKYRSERVKRLRPEGYDQYRSLVDDLDSLRDAIAVDVLRDIPAEAIRTSLDTLVDIKDRIKGVSENPEDVVAK